MNFNDRTCWSFAGKYCNGCKLSLISLALENISPTYFNADHIHTLK